MGPQTRSRDRSLEDRCVSARPRLLLICALGCLHGLAHGQDAVRPASIVLVDAPAPQNAVPLGSIAGTVTDPDGSLVTGAEVIVTGAGELPPIKTLTDGAGRFRVTGLPSGNFKITVGSEGYAPQQVLATLHPGEAVELALTLKLASTSTDVQVTLTREDIAQAEMKDEEHQRLVGFYPNFFVAYDWNGPPLNTRQKFHLAMKTTIDPATILVNAGFAGIQQWQNDFPGYGPGGIGYLKRFGAANADTTVGTFVGGAILPSLLRQDPRYFYKGTGTVRSRILYALSTAFICRGDNGKWQPNYSSIGGDVASGAISNLYYPASSRSAWSLTIENGLISAATDGLGNVVQEFLFKKMTPHSMTYSQTKP